MQGDSSDQNQIKQDQTDQNLIRERGEQMKRVKQAVERRLLQNFEHGKAGSVQDRAFLVEMAKRLKQPKKPKSTRRIRR